ncbi:G5 domain-containing protein [Xylanimonas allomyrinae]|uniref:aggregation-promoting factor C-terminal-like domain-containing protein n=1 Tax=Xylanimonas allomyrinae TaxID=2509459 RepID=UPI001FEC0432|nr:G5 domain-containing protein [Xylanimonas allomyrinae]
MNTTDHESTATPTEPAADTTATTTATTTDTPARRRSARSRRLPLVAGLVTASLAVSGGAVAYADAHKNVTLDVDGHLTTISTFAGSVQGLLDARGVRVNERDLVSPAADQPLTDGADVVVRYARELTIQADGTQTTTWVTALDAGEALAALAARGNDVALVASRSGERASLALRLDADGPVAVVADGTPTVVPEGRNGIDAALAAAHVTLGAQDTVRVVGLANAGLNAADLQTVAARGAGVAVVVQRVVTQDVTTEHAVPFETQTQDDATLYRDQTKVAQQGQDGVRTVVETVVTVDGAETSRTVKSDEVTTPPVAKIVAQGTKERPQTPPPAAGAGSTGAASGPVMSGSPRAIGQELAAARGWTGEQWQCLDSLFQKESGWNPSAANPSSGAYGIPQALPGSKMGSVAADWRTNPATQITWGLGYIAGRYGTPCTAWGHSQSTGWY